MRQRRSAGSIGFWTSVVGICLPAVALPAARKPYGGTLQVPVLGTIECTDPARVESESEWMVARQLHETLFRLSPTGEPVPALAQSLPTYSTDGREWIIRLRPDALFHDGTSVTSAEVLGSWERLLSPSTGSAHWWLLAPIKGAVAFRQNKVTRITGIERLNRLTLRIRLQSPTPDFITALASLPTAVLPMRAQRKKEPGECNPPGAGSFRLSAQGDSAAIQLTPFEGHWRGRPYLDRLVLQTFGSKRDASLAFELGRVQIGFQPPSRRAGGVRVVDGPNNRIVFLVMNPKRLVELPDGIRQAVQRAIDRKSLADYLVGERGSATDEMLIFGERSESERALNAQPKKAREYFQRMAVKRLGMPTLFEFIVRQEDPLERAAAERIQIDLMDVGVSVFVVPLERHAYEERVREERYDFLLARPLPLVAAVELQFLGAVARIGGEQAVADLVQSLARLPQDASRAGLVRERARGYQSGIHWLVLFIHGQRLFLRESVRGFEPDVVGLADFGQVWLAQ